MDFAQNFNSEMGCELLVSGNTPKDTFLDWATAVFDGYTLAPQTKVEVDVVQLPVGSATVWMQTAVDTTQSNSAVEIYFQLPGRDAWHWQEDGGGYMNWCRSPSVFVPPVCPRSNVANLCLCSEQNSRTRLGSGCFWLCWKMSCMRAYSMSCERSSNLGTAWDAAYGMLRSVQKLQQFVCEPARPCTFRVLGMLCQGLFWRARSATENLNVS